MMKVIFLKNDFKIGLKYVCSDLNDELVHVILLCLPSFSSTSKFLSELLNAYSFSLSLPTDIKRGTNFLLLNVLLTMIYVIIVQYAGNIQRRVVHILQCWMECPSAIADLSLDSVNVILFA